jgi:hypothetical protein
MDIRRIARPAIAGFAVWENHDCPKPPDVLRVFGRFENARQLDAFIFKGPIVGHQFSQIVWTDMRRWCPLHSALAIVLMATCC